ncbi:Bladder cancer-related BC10-like protein [Macrophomina phaseolina MS6]|uniref:Bladder cancer-related BC10-like protein n=1 Tax=Macrophomina phaseolina (strain MS6) TaxID=1126212 RepID=K2S297_MACPH|nr:Bladder cancer-related BC10-like protein [Macrophomina phaseolina MS6]
MFCLRSWIPILFFLTNASPVYLVLFISATYFLNRPCVYCSLLLAILVIALFDFNTSWFEPNSRYHPESSASPSPNDSYVPPSNSSLAADIAMETMSLLASTVNNTAGALVSAAMEGIKRKRGAPEAAASINTSADWGKGLFTRKEWKVPCMDVIVRL